MAYDALSDLLGEEATPVSVTALPDGSIDVYYRVLDRRGGQITSRVAFGQRLQRSETESIPVERVATDLGGQAVNAAEQASALGDDVTLLGFLDDPRFEEVDAHCVSMGSPAVVHVYEFADVDLLLAETEQAMADWTFDDLRAAAGDGFREYLAADAVFCGNWVSFDNMTAALGRLAEVGPDGGWFVLDPGDVTDSSEADLESLLAALGDLDDAYDVALSVNRAELDFVADALDVDRGVAAEVTAAVRSATGTTAVVLHGRTRATAATPDGAVTVPSLRVAERARRTGGGDTFGAALGHALAADWGWEAALAFGNLCASYYVEHGAVGDRDALASYLGTRERHDPNAPRDDAA